MTDTGRFECVGFEMGIGPVSRDAVDSLPDSDESRLSPSAVRWFQANLFHYQKLAESVLNSDVAVKHLGTDESPESLKYLAAQYEKLEGQRGAVEWLASYWGVHRTTIHRRLKKAGAAVPKRPKKPRR